LLMGLWVLAGMTAGLCLAAPPARPAGRPTDRSGGGSAAPLYRLSDRRPALAVESVTARGIQRHVSRRLILWTDVMAPEVAQLPALADGAYDHLVKQLGQLPPTREGEEFQVTGYLMRDQRLFRELGLLPDDLAKFDHGRNRGYEFWLNEQPTAYYRAHLLLHEFTHCYTTVVQHGLLKSGWFMEGIAELFATHTQAAEGRWQFGVFPDERARYPGLGRIKLLETARRDNELLSMTGVINQRYERFLQPEGYAWSWALCQFLYHHPRYRERFRGAVRDITTGGPGEHLRELLDQPGLEREWEWFTRDLMHGYDLTGCAIELPEGQRAEPAGDGKDRGSPGPVILANRGWQPTGIRLHAGQPVRLGVQGTFLLRADPQPWQSTAEGVSIRYFGGLPLGRLVGRIWPSDPQVPTPPDLNLGSRPSVQPPIDGWLYLRLNDAWNELADNEGEVRVTQFPEAP